MRVFRIATLWCGVVGAAGCARRPPEAPSVPTPDSALVTGIQPVPTYVCHRSGSKILIDGRPTEDVWEHAEPAGPFSLWDGEPAARTTQARLLWDAQNLYLAVDCADPDIHATMARRDENLWEENEVVELFADANGDERCYLEFEVNPRNTVLDLIIPEAGGGGSLVGKKCWDAKGLRSAVVKESTARAGEWVRWTVELAIPMDCFLDAPNCPPAEGDEWRVNLYRVDQSAGEVEFQAWSPTNTEKPNFHVPDRFGVLRFTEALAGGEATE